MYHSLHAGRGLAAAGVALVHLGGICAGRQYFGADWALAALAPGTCGVEFFFILSGFVIVTAHRADLAAAGGETREPFADRARRVWTFARRRAVRMHVPYVAAFLLFALPAVALATWRPGAVPESTVPTDPLKLVAAATLCPLDHDWVGGSVGRAAPILTVAWTLQYEVLFYAAFALVLLDRRLIGPLIGGTAALWAAGRCGAPLDYPLDFFATDYPPLFAAGAGVAWARRRWSGTVGPGWAKALTTAGALGTAAVLIEAVLGGGGKRTGPFGEWEVFARGAAFVVLTLGLVLGEDAGWKVGRSAAARWLGNVSYAWYLIHQAIFSLFFKLAVVWGWLEHGLTAMLPLAAVSLAASLAAAAVFHHAFEVPAVAWCRRRFLPPRSKPAAGGALRVVPANGPAATGGPIPVDPIPVDPIPVDPIPVDPIPVDPIPVDPITADDRPRVPAERHRAA